jgi:hypothetical protein
MDVAVVVLGRIAFEEDMGRRSSDASGSSVTGHRPVSCTTFSIRRRSKTRPDVLETTGSSGTVPLTATERRNEGGGK